MHEAHELLRGGVSDRIGDVDGRSPGRDGHRIHLEKQNVEKKGGGDEHARA